jgi:hypothetical protein
MSMLSDALRFVRNREVVARQIGGELHILPMISRNATLPVRQSRGGRGSGACSPCDTLQIGQWAAYQPPQVARVSLRPEEAVLGYCKVSGSARPTSGSCKALLSYRSQGS